MPDLLIATNNAGKVRELRALLASLPEVPLLTPAELGLALEPDETGSSYADNAAIKARAFAQAAGLPALADDSGLEVAGLNDAPGVHSARYSPQPGANDADRRQYLLQQLAALGQPQPWTARFVSVVCLAFPDGTAHFAEGECRGEIVPHERGTGGFGYDPIFVVEGTGSTMAELSFEDKNQLSHRARAVQGLRARLAQL
ncbi:MAG TPA: RdgB/HAM1 family non-canonical purine NTP pyrophosphatase [Anaerolineales bacterium]|nr:RdgB/HAM1 family non-canonical purine NTP pyrophosphatase [Anaerolineales bacterium]HRQ92133.1 RdgB/HAM1 family non-canonical purine NTP pyrophosphatase [Anaerolineales bacterium]